MYDNILKSIDGGLGRNGDRIIEEKEGYLWKEIKSDIGDRIFSDGYIIVLLWF